ncbi:resolvase, N-terminal [Flammeovirgaceae bacterium 311]|nr:resolvase, N-terminal [Flammeovirgaceae bacterium 311]
MQHDEDGGRKIGGQTLYQFHQSRQATGRGSDDNNIPLSAERFEFFHKEINKKDGTIQKSNGFILSNPENLALEAQWKGMVSTIENGRIKENNIKAGEMARLLKKEGASLRKVAYKLNQLGNSTRYGKTFYVTSVKRLLEKKYC